jgi:hypothetical protein
MIDYDLRLLMPDKVTIELPVSKDMYGKTVYGPPVEYQCRIEQANNLTRDLDGRERVSSAQVYLATATMVPLGSRVTYPDGSQPSIMSVEAVQDEDGSYTTKLST